MTIPTTPTGGEPTAGPWTVIGDAAHKGNRRITSKDRHHIAKVYARDASPDDETEANARLIASAPTLAARVAELEGKLAVAREALRPFGSLYDRALKITGESFAGRVNTCIVNGWLNVAHFALAAQAITQLDKEAGGK